MNNFMDQWLQIGQIAKLFGLSEESIKRLAKNHGFPLRRLTPYATPGVLQSEMVRWLKQQPPIGQAIRTSAGRETGVNQRLSAVFKSSNRRRRR
jgi:hypothetical protein